MAHAAPTPPVAQPASALSGKYILGIGAWTPRQTAGKRGGNPAVGNPFAGSMQALAATLLAPLFIVLLVCEYNTSSLCIWCAL